MIIHEIEIPKQCPEKCKQEILSRNVYMGQGGMCHRCPVMVLECEKMVFDDYIESLKERGESTIDHVFNVDELYPREWAIEFKKWFDEYKDLPVLKGEDGKVIFSF